MGILEFALQPGSPGLEVIAFCFGAGAALTLDEFALVLHLEDVYWTGEGRKSIDAIILGVTFMTLLLTGLPAAHRQRARRLHHPLALGAVRHHHRRRRAP